MGTLKLSDLIHDYLRLRKEEGEHTSLDSAAREILDRGADSEWRDQVREWRQAE